MTHRVIVIGKGYSGQRFARAFTRAGELHRTPVEVNLLGREDTRTLRSRSGDTEKVIRDANVIINATNDDQHHEVFDIVSQAQGTVIWEKPLLTPGGNREEPDWPIGWGEQGRFALNCIERYSRAVDAFHHILHERELRIARINFVWAKNRFDDPRPTVGVASEIIHPLDLVCYLTGGDPNELQIHHASAIASDYRSQPHVALESASVTAHIEDTVITGYSSFAHPGRRRVFDLTLVTPRGGREYVELTFDEPLWDRDRLHHWSDGQEICDKWIISATQGDPDTCGKLTRFASDILFAEAGQRFTTLHEARSLQRILNDIETSRRIELVYGRGEQRHVFGTNDLERLG